MGIIRKLIQNMISSFFKARVKGVVFSAFFIYYLYKSAENNPVFYFGSVFLENLQKCSKYDGNTLKTNTISQDVCWNRIKLQTVLIQDTFATQLRFCRT